MAGHLPPQLPVADHSSFSAPFDISFDTKSPCDGAALTMLLSPQRPLGVLILSCAVQVINAAPGVSRLVPRGNCPYTGGDVHTVTMEIQGWPRDNYELNLQYLGSGLYGCGYDVLGSLQLPDGRSVHAAAKTTHSRKDDADEIRALQGIQEFYGLAKDKYGNRWVLMQWHSGRKITHTKAFKERFPKGFNEDLTDDGIKSCEGFLRRIYQLAVTENLRYGKTYGWVNIDPNIGNYLFDDELTHAEIIDWGMGEEIGKVDNQMHEDYMKEFEMKSNFPIRDNSWAQGICQSKQRSKYGLPFNNRVI